MPTAIYLLVYLLAVARVVRLITSDRIFETPRMRFVSWVWGRSVLKEARALYPNASPAGQRQMAEGMATRQMGARAEPPLLAYMATCPWCVSIYVGAVAAPIIWFWGTSPWLAVPALALALSHATGVLASKGE